MSDAASRDTATATAPAPTEPTSRRTGRRWGATTTAAVVAVVVSALLPLVFSDFWLQTGLFVMATAIGAVGLTLLVGVGGQLSLGHAFFMALGAYTYSWAAGIAEDEVSGLGLSPVLALLLAGLFAAVAGLLFSPISGRLRGIYLGLATLGLVFLARHLMNNLESLTGGFVGRNVEPFAVPGFSFSNSSPDYLAVVGVEFTGLHRLWYLFLALLVLAMVVGRNIKDSRTGRALANVRDSETAAASVGVHVSRVKATGFVISSAYAGVAGALIALAYGRIAPDLFVLQMSIDFLVIIVLGGLGSITGALAGSVFVVTLPLVLTQYSSVLPFLAAPGSGGIDGASLARLLYAAAIIAVLVFLRGGLVPALTRLVSTRRDPTPPRPRALDQDINPPPTHTTSTHTAHTTSTPPSPKEPTP